MAVRCSLSYHQCADLYAVRECGTSSLGAHQSLCLPGFQFYPVGLANSEIRSR
ncbi:Uncharacterised protein [Vibrio cholerae]|nr:Uncharacterised protein [Vibrio cholerae]